MSIEQQHRTWFREKVLPHEYALRVYAKRFSASGMLEAEDLVHEVLVRAITYEAWRDIHSPLAFLKRTLKNLALDTLQKRRVVSIHALADVTWRNLADESPGPEAVTTSRQELQLLVDAIRNLPPQCRRVFILRKVYGQSPPQIAVELGISVSTVEKHLAKGLRYCSARLAGVERSPARNTTSPSWNSPTPRRLRP